MNERINDEPSTYIWILDCSGPQFTLSFLPRLSPPLPPFPEALLPIPKLLQSRQGDFERAVGAQCSVDAIVETEFERRLEEDGGAACCR